LRHASEMSGRRIAVLSASHPFLFVAEFAPAGVVKIFTDDAAFRAWCASPEAAGHVLSVRHYDFEELVHAFYDPTNAGRHVRAIVAVSRFFATGANPTRDEGPGLGAAAKHAALWAAIHADSHLGQAQMWLRLRAEVFAPEELAAARALIERAERYLNGGIPADPSAGLRSGLKWALRQMQGESGAGENYWEQFPEYRAAWAALNEAEGRK
jgi:hypothetical protein